MNRFKGRLSLEGLIIHSDHQVRVCTEERPPSLGHELEPSSQHPQQVVQVEDVPEVLLQPPRPPQQVVRVCQQLLIATSELVLDLCENTHKPNTY